MDDELTKKLEELKIEDYIWIIYIGIIIMSWYSNTLERNYFIYNDQDSKEKYRKTIISIFTILIFIYLYFLKSSYNDLINLREKDTDEKKLLVFLAFIGSLLIVISGFIFLYIAIRDEELNVELAFN